jgi:signal transduction histidine kinase
MTAERKKELFSPVRSASSGGVGIGLTVAQRAITAQGGEIHVSTEPGQGTTFWFHLPRRVRENNREGPFSEGR